MHLFNLTQFSYRFGIDLSVSDFHEAVVRASKAATEDLASRFRYTDFGVYASRTDLFFVPNVHFQGRGQSRKFMLSRGLTTKAAITAYYTETPIHFRNNETNSLTNLKDTAGDGQSDYLWVDGDKGIMTVADIDLSGMYVVATYTGGLSVATDDEFEGVPDWLQEAAMAQTALNLSRHRAFIPEEGQGDLEELTEALGRLTLEHRRYRPDALRPMATE